MIRGAVIAATAVACLTAASFASAATAATAAGPIVLAPRVMLTVQERERLQAIAAEGADALRRYLWRTRMIHAWSWHDLVGGND